MKRRTFLQLGLVTACVKTTVAAIQQNEFDLAADVLNQAANSRLIRAASLYVRQGRQEFTHCVGACNSPDDVFLLASISKPISVSALMTLAEQFHLDDAVRKFIPEFSGDGRENTTIRHLLTHVSGLPDQLPDNGMLRARHAPLSEFVVEAIRTPLLFEPGSKYSYSSMGILLASEIASRIAGQSFPTLVKQSIFVPLGMKRSALGMGDYGLHDLMQCQVEDAAPESGAGDPSAKDWDWNSRYWRSLAAPWGGAHASAPDVAKFLNEFLHPGKVFEAELARTMVGNHNRAGLTPRGLGFALGPRATSPRCSALTFGHGGSTGTLAWADPETDTVCVVLTTLPSAATTPHPRQLVADRIAKAMS